MKNLLYHRFRVAVVLLVLLECALTAAAQQVAVSGFVTDADSRQPVEYASILVKEGGQWAISDAQGRFGIKNVPPGRTVITIQCLGYRTEVVSVEVSPTMSPLRIALRQESLKLDEVTVLAKRKTGEATSSYTIDKTALENQQIINIGDISTLLPGGKTINPSLMNDERLALRSGSGERGNASFGTAIEVDGIRIDNNASPTETMAASTRTVGVSNVESVEIVTGIPSVEYGDLSNGVVKVNTMKGKTPFIVEGSINHHTRQIALNKGFDLGHHRGVLNASIEHANSFADAASPHTAYQRNILSLNYMNVLMGQSMPLTLNVGFTANLGGYNSEADPDEELDDYTKARDNVLRTHIELNWLLNKPWLTNVSISGALSVADKKTERYAHNSSASTQPYIHTTEEGYCMAVPGASLPSQPPLSSPQGESEGASAKGGGIVLSPTGYWHVRSYTDSKPLNYSLRLKAKWSRRFGTLRNRMMVGAQYSGSRNNGRGTYYERLELAPTWREYRYDELPTMNNLALYAEEKLSLPTGQLSTLELTAGLRDDITLISGSDYGTVSSLSPRFNSRYVFWREQANRWVGELSLHAGWGKSVKLPSFQVLYPAPSYRDMLAFSSPSTSTNTSFYAYYTHPSSAIYNPQLKWQYTLQTDMGIDLDIKGTKVSLTAFRHRTHNPYMATAVYSPFAYLYTPPAALNGVAIALADRIYDIHRQTGIVSVSDATGQHPAVTLDGNTRHTYLTNQKYVNASPLDRYGLEWIIDFAQFKPLHTALRIDGNYYYYRGIDSDLFADIPNANATMSDGQPYQYVGYYRGSNVTSAGMSASASVANGSLSKHLNLNATITTHIPKIRLIVALRLESSLYSYQRSLSELEDAPRGIVLADKSSYTGQPYDGNGENQYVAVYPEYYSTWENPDERIPFAEKFLWAKDNDPTLFSDLSKLVVRANYPYVMNPNRISSYYSANLSVTKEIGSQVSLSFYANNFFNNMKTVHSSQTDLDTSLFASSFIPSFYYGLSLRVKL